MPEQQPVLRSHGLRREFTEAGERIDVLRGIDLTVHRGEKVAIVGPSGSGKTALLNLLGGLEPPSAGWVEIGGHRLQGLSDSQLSAVRRKLGFVYQFSHLLGQLSAWENVAMPLYLEGLPRARARARALKLLADVGLENRADAAATDLSGGERQRVAVARAFANNPICLLMDEPTGSLDAGHTGKVRDLIHKLVAERGTSVLLATHDSQLAGDMDRTLQLEKGQLKAE